MKYRREIDGLRSIAVVPVILFHAGFEFFSGGFVGVDVFFVISGYLITTIILADLEAGKFSLVTFYERRARRILPALFLVLGVCIPAAWLWLLPEDMKSFSQSVASVTLFLSNVLFWRQSGYFETAAELKPLLHTWSLAVEEQFYTLFPLFLMLTWKLGKRWIAVILTIVALASIALAEWGSRVNPGATFFLLPTRGWELAIGALTAIHLSTNQRLMTPSRTAEVLSTLGLALILFSVFAYTKKTPFPGLYALAPTIGAALIILHAGPQNIAGKLLGSRVPVGIGLISYSAYLWHQPLIAFAKHRTFNDGGIVLALALAVGSLVLAYFSWRFVEQPFRRSATIGRPAVFRFAVVGSALFLAVGIAGHLTSGFSQRYDNDKGEFLAYFENSLPEWKYFEKVKIGEHFGLECGFFDASSYRSGSPSRRPVESIPNSCFRRDPEIRNAVFVWGDSHAQQLHGGLRNALPPDWQLLQVASSGCPPRLGAHASSTDYCEQSNWFAYRSIVEIRPEVVLIAQFGDHEPVKMKEMADELTRLGVTRVLFAGPTPRWRLELPKIVATRLWENTPHRSLVGVNLATIADDEKLKRDFEGSGTSRLVSLVDFFCDKKDGCLVYTGNDKKEGITTWDYGHLTPTASSLLAKEVLIPLIVNSR